MNAKKNLQFLSEVQLKKKFKKLTFALEASFHKENSVESIITI